MVMHLDRHTHLFERQTHSCANIVQRINRLDREVAAFRARAMPHIAVGEDTLRVPAGLFGIDLVEGAAHVRAPAHIVQNKEFGLRTEVRRIGDARRLQIGFGALAQGARVALVPGHGVGFQDIAADDQGVLVREGIHDGGGGFRHQDHVRRLDSLPTRDRRAVEHLAVPEKVFVDHPRRHRDVLLFAACVGEAKVDELHVVVLDHFDHVCHLGFLRCCGFGGNMAGRRHGRSVGIGRIEAARSLAGRPSGCTTRDGSARRSESVCLDVLRVEDDTGDNRRCRSPWGRLASTEPKHLWGSPPGWIGAQLSVRSDLNTLF